MKKSLLSKILLMVGVPIAFTFAVMGFIIMNIMENSVSELANSGIEAQSQAITNEIDGYFTKYKEVAKQMGMNPDIEAYLHNTRPGNSILATPNYDVIKQLMDNVQASDSDIQVAWIADFDSSQIIQSDGYVSDESYLITSRPWYQQLMEKKSVFVSEPYVDVATNKIIVSVISPIYQSETSEIIGATSIDVFIDKIHGMLDANRIGETGYFILTTESGIVFEYPDEDYLNKAITDAPISQNLLDSIQNKTRGMIEFNANKLVSQGELTVLESTGWVLTSAISEREFLGKYETIKMTIFVIVVLSIAMIIGIFIVIAKRITKPIQELAKAADNMAEGDVNVVLDKKMQQLQDEVGELARAFKRMNENIRSQAKAAELLSKGDFSAELKAKSDKDIMVKSLVDIKKSVAKLVEDTLMLSEAAISGDFMKRADLSNHQGEYRSVIAGVNQTLDKMADKTVQYESILDAIPFPLQVMDREMKWIFINKAFEQLMILQGVFKNREEGYGMDCCNAKADICNSSSCGIRQLLDEGKTESYFDWFGRKSKQDTAFVCNHLGEKVGFVEIVTDLSRILKLSNFIRSEVEVSEFKREREEDLERNDK